MLRILGLLSCPMMLQRIVLSVEAMCTDAGLRAELRRVPSWSEVQRTAGTWNPHGLVFESLERFDPCAIEGFRCRFPQSVLVAYGAFRSPRDVLRLSEAGVRELIEKDVDDTPAAIAHALSRLLTQQPPAAAEALFSRFPHELHNWLRSVYVRSDQPIRCEHAAALLQRHPKTARERLRREGLPPLERTLRWIRLIRAAETLAQSTRSVEAVALQLGFPSAAAFGNLMMRYTGQSPSQVRTGGGAEVVVAALERACRQTEAARSAV